MNDPIIHAPISKIVDAIKNEIPDHEENRFNGVQVYGIPMYNIETITEALASLGGEGLFPTRQQIIELAEVRYADIGKQEAFIEGAISVIEKCYLPNTTHPSEREVLEGFREWNNNKTCGFSWFSQDKIDRYLAEKQSKIE